MAVRWVPKWLRKALKGQTNQMVVNDNGDIITQTCWKSDVTLIGEEPSSHDVAGWKAGDRGFGISTDGISYRVFLMYMPKSLIPTAIEMPGIVGEIENPEELQ